MDITENSSEVVEDALGSMDLLPEQQMVILEVFEWVKRMSNEHGPTVRSKDGTTFDWGQALCREQFGSNWQKHMTLHNIAAPTKQDLERAKRWENGEVPDWVENA